MLLSLSEGLRPDRPHGSGKRDESVEYTPTQLDKDRCDFAAERHVRSTLPFPGVVMTTGASIAVVLQGDISYTRGHHL